MKTKMKILCLLLLVLPLSLRAQMYPIRWGDMRLVGKLVSSEAASKYFPFAIEVDGDKTFLLGISGSTASSFPLTYWGQEYNENDSIEVRGEVMRGDSESTKTILYFYVNFLRPYPAEVASWTGKIVEMKMPRERLQAIDLFCYGLEVEPDRVLVLSRDYCPVKTSEPFQFGDSEYVLGDEIEVKGCYTLRHDYDIYRLFEEIDLVSIESK